MPSPALTASVLAPLRRLRRRMRAQAALDGAGRASLIASALVLLAVYLWRLGVLGPTGLGRAAVAACALIAAGALVGAARRIPLPRVAKRADLSHALDDRLGSALAFLDERAPTPFMLAAIEDAARHAPRVQPKRAAPFARPRGLASALLVSAVAGVVALLHFPERAHVLAPPPPGAPHLAVDHDLLQPEREAAAELERQAAESHDPETKQLAGELQQLLDQLDREELTRKQVFDKLAELENKLKPEDGNFEELERALKKAGTELGKEKLTRDAGEALAKEDLAKAKQELEKLAAEAERLDKEKKPDEAKREELARSLKRAADAKPPEKSADEKKREQEEQRLKEEQRRLQKQLAEKPNDRELQRRLERNQRELQRLEREKQQRAEQERQLQRLQRELQQAAEQLRQKLSPEAAEALRRAAQQLGQMENEIRKLGNGSKARMQIAELKEMLRRAGSIQPGSGQPQDGQGDQQANGRGVRPGQKDGPGGRGQNGKGKDAKSMLRDFNNRAGGEKTLLLGQGGDTPILLPLPTGPGGEKPGPQGQGGHGEQQPGDGIGDEHDPNLTGDPTKLASKRHDTRVDGKDGAGPSRSETILGSAERGFSTKAYRRVYSDYTSVAEEVMSKERVPPGYRFYIKRYFQLIKPRD